MHPYLRFQRQKLRAARESSYHIIRDYVKHNPDAHLTFRWRQACHAWVSVHDRWVNILNETETTIRPTQRKKEPKIWVCIAGLLLKRRKRKKQSDKRRIMKISDAAIFVSWDLKKKQIIHKFYIQITNKIYYNNIFPFCSYSILLKWKSASLWYGMDNSTNHTHFQRTF